MNYAFLNADSTVTQVISGLLNEQQQAQFLRDYAVPFQAVAVIEVAEAVRVWIGGTYDATTGEFLPPPAPPSEPTPTEPPRSPEEPA